jgi:hypothetical protein
MNVTAQPRPPRPVWRYCTGCHLSFCVGVQADVNPTTYPIRYCPSCGCLNLRQLDPRMYEI